MGISLIIAEKPSVAMNIAQALSIMTRKDGYFEGQDYIVTWAFGHLLQLFDTTDYEPEKMATWKMENFPFIPDKFQYKPKVDPKDRSKPDTGAKKQLDTIKRLIFQKNVDQIISAVDNDREGQTLGDLIIYHFNHKKDVYRLLLNEWTPDEVRKGLKNIVPNSDLKPIQDAGIGRQWADWTIGINLTTVSTLKYQKGGGKALNIGRVLLPTLKIIYDRDKEIEQFKPEDYFKLTAAFETNKGDSYTGVYHEQKEKEEDKFKDKSELLNLLSELAGEKGHVVNKEVSKKVENPPFLFNLSNLQGHITSKYNNWTSDKVLKVAQALYEKKFITYPRVVSQRLEESLIDRAAKVLNVHKKGLPYEGDIQFSKSKRIFDNSKVDSHSAIIPTYMVPEGLTDEEDKVYQAIKNRFIMQFMPSAEYEETKISTKVDKVQKGVFLTKGKVELARGWKQVEDVKSEDTLIPLISEKEVVSYIEGDISSHTTKPPKNHTEKSLLRVMETCGKGKQNQEGREEDSEHKDHEEDESFLNAILSGYSIGTPATRAETIKKLKDVGYITNKNKNLMCTDLGKRLVEVFPIKELLDLDFTGRLEKALSDIEKGKVKKEVFLQFIFNFTNKAVQKIKDSKDITLVDTKAEKQKESLGVCPKCQKGYVFAFETFYGCSEFKQSDCRFGLNRELLGKKISEAQMKKLLSNGKTDVIKGFTSNNKKKFDAYLLWDQTEKKVKFGFPNASSGEKKEAANTSIPCPICRRNMKEYDKFYGCSGYQENKCEFSLSKVYLGKTVTTDQLKNLCVNGETDTLSAKKDGRKVQWKLIFAKEQNKVMFRYVK